MKKKIVIIGALGYLGTELSKLYSGESWYNKIVAIDNRFVSERVNQLRNWNIEFFQGQILDKSFLKIHLEDADIVHHLAGITDVAYVKKESSQELDDKIKKMTLNAKIETIDSCTADGAPFVNVSGIGFDAHIANLFQNLKKRGFWNYIKLIYMIFQ